MTQVSSGHKGPPRTASYGSARGLDGYEPVLLARQSEYFSMFMAGSLQASRARPDGRRNRKSFQGQLRPGSRMVDGSPTSTKSKMSSAPASHIARTSR